MTQELFAHLAQRHEPRIADVIPDRLFIKVKLRQKHSAVNPWDEIKSLADREGKTPVICLCEKNPQGFWIMAYVDHF